MTFSLPQKNRDLLEINRIDVHENWKQLEKKSLIYRQSSGNIQALITCQAVAVRRSVPKVFFSAST